MSLCAGRRTHLLHDRPECHRWLLPLIAMMPRAGGHYHVARGRSGQPIYCPSLYPIECHGRRASVTYLLAAASPSSPKFVAIVVPLYKLSVSLAPRLCYEPSPPSADPSCQPECKVTGFPPNRPGTPP
jgi:hypothetical protein